LLVEPHASRLQQRGQPERREGDADGADGGDGAVEVRTPSGRRHAAGEEREGECGCERGTDEPDGDEQAVTDLPADVDAAHRRSPLPLQQADVAVGVAEAGQPEPVAIENRAVQVEVAADGRDGGFGYGRLSEPKLLGRVGRPSGQHERQGGRRQQNRDGGSQPARRIPEHGRGDA
jgi:hypothetical protein